MTHRDLVARAARWLRTTGRCSVVLADMQTIRTTEQPDVIGWCRGTYSIMVECKASRSDFRRDKHKPSRRSGQGMGCERWYFAPAGVVPLEEVPPLWGLAVVDDRGRVRRLQTPGGSVFGKGSPYPGPEQPRHVRSHSEEIGFLLGALGKVQTGHVADLLRALGVEPAPP